MSVESQLPDEVVAAVRRSNVATSRVERWKRLGICYCAALLTVLTPVAVVTAVKGNSTADDAVAILRTVRAAQIESTKRGIDIKASSANSARTLELIQGCLSPGGKCNQRNQRNQAAVIDQLGQLWTYAGLCLNNPNVPQNTGAQQDCVARLIRENANG